MWFKAQKHMLEHCDTTTAKNNGVREPDSLLVAWDRKRGKDNATVKSYAYYKSYEAYFKDLCDRQVGTRNGYEFIRTDTPAKLYLDVEWIGEPDHEHEVVRQICQDVTVLVNKNRPPPVKTTLEDTVVMCSTREIDNGVTKNSYHLVFPDIVFANNHDGRMKWFVSLLKSWSTKIDSKVYTKNRCLRTLMCSKLGSSTAFVLLQGEERTAWLNSLVTLGVSDPYVYIDTQKTPYFCDVGDFKLTPAAKNMPSGTKRKKTQPPPSTDGHGESEATNPHTPNTPAMMDTTIQTLPTNFVRFFVGPNTTLKQIVMTSATPDAHIPPAVRYQLQHRLIGTGDILLIYIENPKQCPADLITGKVHTHHSNNAVAVIVQYHGPQDNDVYVKCFCACKPRLSEIYRPSLSTKEMPKIAGVVKTVLETIWGINNVKDTKERKDIIKLFDVPLETRHKYLEKEEFFIAWNRILPVEQWCFIPVATTLEEYMPPLPLLDDSCKPSFVTDTQSETNTLPVAVICPFIGKSYSVHCPVCEKLESNFTERIKFNDGEALCEGEQQKSCTQGHQFIVRTYTTPGF